MAARQDAEQAAPTATARVRELEQELGERFADLVEAQHNRQVRSFSFAKAL